MRLYHALRTGAGIAVVFAAALCPGAQEPAAPPKEAHVKETAQGLPPRVSPNDYASQGKAGDVTIAADFVGHSVPTAQGALTTEDFIVVESGLYGPPESHLQISLDDFSLRVNGKKNLLRSQPFGLLLSSIKDPEYVPPEAAPSKNSSKTSIGGSGGGQADPNSPPPVVHIPIEVQRSMAQRTQKASLPLGDRVLPQAGLLFFQYHGKTKGISSIELVYSGPAGKLTMPLRP